MKPKQTKKPTDPSEIERERLRIARLCGTLAGCSDEFTRAQKAILGAVARLRDAAPELPSPQGADATALAAELEANWKSNHERDLRLLALLESLKPEKVKGK